MSAASDKVTKARELCGCIQCHGGYGIGARTIAAGVGGSNFEALVTAPSSCVASVLLQALLDNKLQGDNS